MIRIILIDKTCSVHISISRLTKVLVSKHLVLEANQHFFHVVIALPVSKNMELRRLNSAILLVDAGQVNL